MIELDGSMGEGGGQILRTALTLSMITGQPFRIRQIRANRVKPGLMRQHLVAVQAAAHICDAMISGDAVGSQELEFIPQAVRGGNYRFDIGTAGSCTLVLQTVLPALLSAGVASSVRVIGGTHNPMAPPVHFLQRAWQRVMREMGAEVDIDLHRFGFYPAGGGEVLARVQPGMPSRRIVLHERGALTSAYAECFTARVPPTVAQRELECVAVGMGWTEAQLRAHDLPRDQGPGNALLITMEYENVTQVFAGIGAKSIRAEEVAHEAIRRAQTWLSSDAAVDEYLADQLMLPMALAGGGSFTCESLSMHTTTNAAVIERFLPVGVSFGSMEGSPLCTIA